MAGVGKIDALRLELFLGQSEGGSLGVLADRPALSGVDDASTERLYVLQRVGYIAHCEVGHGGATLPRLDGDARLPDRRRWEAGHTTFCGL